jgi:DNA-binding NtrC family response regulator
MKPIKVVIIDDEEAHLELIKQAIGRELPLASVDWFEEARACLERLDEISPDVIITDYLMVGMDGLEFLQALNRDNRDIPVIMITGYGDQNIAVQAMKLGVSDYLVKIPGFHALLPSVIKKVFCEQELKKSLRRSERRFRDMAETISDWIWEMDVEGKYTYSNPAVKEILGYDPHEVVGKRFCDFFIDKKKRGLTGRTPASHGRGETDSQC